MPENRNEVFVTLAKRKSHGRLLSYFVSLFKSSVGWKYLGLTVGVGLIILILVFVSVGVSISAKKVTNGR